MATDQPMTLDDHVDRVTQAAEAHTEALASPGRTVSVPTDDGPYDLPLALITAKRLDDSRHDAMTHIHGPGGVAEEYAAAQSEWEGSLADEDRQREQEAALALQAARQRVREAHGQPGHRVAGDAVRG